MVAWPDHVVAAWSLFVLVRAKMVAWSVFGGLARVAEKRGEEEGTPQGREQSICEVNL